MQTHIFLIGKMMTKKILKNEFQILKMKIPRLSDSGAVFAVLNCYEKTTN